MVFFNSKIILLKCTVSLCFFANCIDLTTYAWYYLFKSTRIGGLFTINVCDLTLTYSSGKGIFNVDFSANEGDVIGYLGPNGAGKTTTIRALLGFMAPQKGKCTIDGCDCFQNASQIQKSLGYVPGESVLPSSMRGDEFLKFMADMRGSRDLSRQKQLVEMFELNPYGSIRKFSKGMKQKLAIVAAFMHDPKVIILDEPTSGLDPLMQNRFIELILSEKARGKTILMSSHIFEEIEKTCDTVLIIKNGRIVVRSDIATLKSSQRKSFIITPENAQTAPQLLQQSGFIPQISQGGTIEITVTGENIDKFAKTISEFKLLDLDIKTQTLEDVFMHFYGKDGE